MGGAKQQRYSRQKYAIWPAMPAVVQYRPRPAEVHFESGTSSFLVKPGHRKKTSKALDLHDLTKQFVAITDERAALKFMQAGGNFLADRQAFERDDVSPTEYRVTWPEILAARDLVECAWVSSSSIPAKPLLPFQDRRGRFQCGLSINMYRLNWTLAPGEQLDDSRLICEPRASLEAICMDILVNHHAGMRYGRCASERCRKIYRVKSSISRCCSQECARQVCRLNGK